MSLTNKQARKILLELYAANLDPRDTMSGVLNANRSAAVWKACEALEAADAAAPKPEPPQVEKGKAD